MRGNSTFSKTVEWEKRLLACMMKPTLPRLKSAVCWRLKESTSWPSMESVPESGAWSMPSTWSMVDLPQPEGPMMATISPAQTSMSTPLSTGAKPA